ncbi:hypothetical protein [Streptomyces sp. NPDC051577]|uniref:hypothetical protein n=1 Tax=Streptomyces sp. NPDC051577 TaxID=3155166 RepID=UPI0034339092
MAFPTTPIELLAELQIGGTWTDVTADLYARGPLTIERGRPDEATRVDPAKAGFQLDNRGNKYSPRNPRSVNYGLLGRNTPVRFSVPLGYSYLDVPAVAGSQIATPDHASLDITGDIDVRVEMIPSTWIGTYDAPYWECIGKYQSTGNQRSWLMMGGNGGYVQFRWSADGTGTTVNWSTQPVPAARRLAIRATLDANNGAGGSTVVFYTATSLAGPWTQLGDPIVTAGIASIFNSTASLEIGDITGTNFGVQARRIIRAEVRSGIGGTVVAAPDMRALTPGTTSWADTAGRTWTVGGAASISNRAYRLHAEVSAWPSRWDVSGQDVYVPVEAAGILRRLGQGQKALSSSLRRRIPTFGPVAYWPCEEGSEATQAYSPLPGCAPLAVHGWEFAADAGCAGSDPLPKIDAAASMYGVVPPYTSAVNSWLVALLYSQDAPPASMSQWLTFTTTGTARTIVVGTDAAGISVLGYDVAGSTVINEYFSNSDTFGAGRWFRFDFSAQPSGGNVNFHMGWVDIDGAGSQWNWSMAGTVGTVTRIDTHFGALLSGMRLGHIGVYPHADLGVWGTSDNGYRGEVAGARIRRLCAEEGVPLTHASGDTPMGPQQAAPLLTLLSEAADADGGILHEDREALALRYRGRADFYNQPVALTLDYNTAGHVAPPLEPTDDDQRTRNDRTVTRRSGSSARAVDETGPLSTQAPPAGVGTYDDEVTLNLASDSQVEDIAAWRLHLGTWDEARYPTVHVDLAAAPSLIPAVLAMDIGDRIQIINPPTWLPPGPIDLIVEGYTETIGHPNHWDIILSCSPAGPWTVAVVDDLVTGRADTDGSTLASGITSTATSLSVATVGAPLWSTSGADLPVDIEVAGEVMRVTAISGASSPQTFTVTRSINTVVKAQSSGTDVRFDQAPIISY